MGRHAEFDRAEVLARAMHAFWRNGYEATSVQDLVEATGINRASMYNTFGGKEALFLAALDHYVAHVNARRIAALTDGTLPPREAIARFFDGLVDYSLGEGKRLGCLLTNTAIELGARSKDIELRLAGVYARVQGTFEALIRKGQAEGSIAGGKDPLALSRFLVGTVHGLRVLARGGAKEAVLRDVVEVALTTLD
jgi:TetR/AcrR family transcriptional repressor of nem operon